MLGNLKMYRNGSRKGGIFGKLLLWTERKADITSTGVGRKGPHFIPGGVSREKSDGWYDKVEWMFL